MTLTKKQEKEISIKCKEILDKTTRAFSKLEKEYNVKNMTFSGIHTDEQWISSSGFKK